MSGQHDRCVAHVPIFAGLSAEDQDLVTGLARPLRLAAGEALLADPAAGAPLLVVHRGRVMTYRPNPDGSEHVLRVLEPGDFTGETSVLSGDAPTESARAVEDAELCSFRHRDLVRLLQQHPDVALRMLSAVSRRLADAEDRLAALISRDVTARLAGYLLSLPGEYADGQVRVRLPLPKKDIASLLDTTPESLSRSLNRLTASGAIVVGRHAVTLSDVDALERIGAG